MSISINNYLNGTLQNTWTTRAEKQKQEDSLTEAGKTQQNTASASLDQVNMGEEGIAVTEVSRQQGTGQSTPQKRSVSPYMDTVEISAEGAAASAAIQEQKTGASSMENYGADDLSEYTESELKQMYYRGEITRQEYEDETGQTLE